MKSKTLETNSHRFMINALRKAIELCQSLLVYFSVIHNVFFFCDAVGHRQSDHFVMSNFAIASGIHHNSLGKRLN